MIIFHPQTLLFNRNLKIPWHESELKGGSGYIVRSRSISLDADIFNLDAVQIVRFLRVDVLALLPIIVHIPLTPSNNKQDLYTSQNDEQVFYWSAMKIMAMMM